MKQVFASFGFGVLLFAAWVCIIVLTSQDFAHEGPNSAWAAPIEWWGSAMYQSGLSHALASLGPTLHLVAGFSVLIAPFIFLFSLVSYSALRLMSKRRRMA